MSNFYFDLFCVSLKNDTIKTMISSLLSLDIQWLLFFRSLIGPEWARIIQFTGEFIVLWWAILLIGIWLIGVKNNDEQKKIDALRIFFGIVLVFGIYSIINFWFPQFRPNPQEVAGGIAPLIPHPIDNSFPSGHSLFSGAMLAGIYLFQRKQYLLIITIVIALITWVSRVVGWVHYPGDILAWYCIGFIWVFFLKRVLNSNIFQRKIYRLIIKIATIFKL